MNPVGIGVTFAKISNNLSDPLAWLGGSFIGIVTYLVQPGAPFYGLWIVVACDLISRIITESVNHGGFWSALKNGHIRSDKAMQGTVIKIIAYFMMCVIAAQVNQIIPWETASGLVSNIIYSVLFFVEVMSIAENFLEAGVEEFQWFKRFSKNKLKEVCGEDGGESDDKPPI